MCPLPFREGIWLVNPQDNSIDLQNFVCMVYSLIVRARDLEYGGREFESQSLHLKLETQTS